MKRIGFLAVMLAATVTSASAQANFSGTWVLDTKRSQGIPEGVGITMTVKHTGDRVELESNISSPAGQQTISMFMYWTARKPTTSRRWSAKAAGRANELRSGRPTSLASTPLKAPRSTPEGEGMVSATRKWTLAPDGKTLTMDVAIKSPQESKCPSASSRRRTDHEDWSCAPRRGTHGRCRRSTARDPRLRCRDQEASDRRRHRSHVRRAYVFADVADKMAEALRAHEAARAYEGIATPREFAETLTQHLQEVSRDKHLRIIYAPDGLPQRTAPTAADRARALAEERRRNSGFSAWNGSTATWATSSSSASAARRKSRKPPFPP